MIYTNMMLGTRLSARLDSNMNLLKVGMIVTVILLRGDFALPLIASVLSPTILTLYRQG